MASLKAQMEIMGLLIITIIVVLIILFVLYFTVFNQEQSNLPERLIEIRANNLRNALLKTTLCQDVSIQDEIANCYTGRSFCLASCDELNDKITNIIESSIEDNENYEFNVENFVKLSRGSCQESEISIRQTAICQPIDFNLDVCLSLCL